MSATTTLAVISAGAAKGLVSALQDDFGAAHGAAIDGTFGAVGSMKEKLLAGAPCDVVILTAAMIAELERDGRTVPGTAAPLGRVRTGIAVRAGAALPPIDDRGALLRLLRAATSLYVPDTVRSTAGLHVVKVLRELGIEGEVAPRLKPFPNGAAAMREMALATDAAPVGCTQVTEILYTPGVTLAGALPAEFELATVYSVAVSATARQPDLARRFAQRLAGDDAAELRRAGGFEP